MKRVVFAIACCWAYASAAQTGQALIANPLLSPNKLKEVKRQIMEAGHQELAPKLAMPIAAAPMSPGGAPMPAAFPGVDGMAMPTESVRRALANLRVTAIVGNSALLAPDLPPLPSINVPGQGMPGYPGPQMPGAAPMGMAPGMGMPPGQQFGVQHNMQNLAQSNPQQIRRGTSTTVRHGRRSYVEGHEVTAFVEGDTVRLVMASVPGEVVFQGQVQPAVYSPAEPRPAALEKSNSEYLNNNKPDATSLSVPNGVATANHMPSPSTSSASSGTYPSVAPGNSYPR